MRAKLIGYKSCGAVWQQSASLTRCRGRTGAPHTQVIGLTCSCKLKTSALCLGVRGSVFATLRADATVTVGWRTRRWRRRGRKRMMKMRRSRRRRRGEGELPSAPSREFGHREGKLGEGRRGRRIPDARPRAEAECAWLSRRCAHSNRVQCDRHPPPPPVPQNSCMCGKSASFQHLKLLLFSLQSEQELQSNRQDVHIPTFFLKQSFPENYSDRLHFLLNYNFQQPTEIRNMFSPSCL